MNLIEITAGAPDVEEVAALTVALLALSQGESSPAPRREPAWAVAARLELQGQRPLTSATDPRLR